MHYSCQLGIRLPADLIMALLRDTNVYVVNTTRVFVASHNERALVVGGGVADPLAIEVPCPALAVDTRASSAASTGLKITAAAAGGGVTLSALSSAPNEALLFEPKGAGGIVLGRSDASSGPVTIYGNLVVSGTVSASGSVLGSGGGSVPFPLVVEGAGNAAAFSVRPAVGSANPSFVVNTSASSAGTGIVVTAAAATYGVSIAARSSNAAESLSISSLGAGSLKLQTAASGGPIVCATNIIYKRSITSYPSGASNDVTVAELFGGYLKVNAASSAPTTLRIPSSNPIITTLTLEQGDSFEFIVDNTNHNYSVTLDNQLGPPPGNIEFSGTSIVSGLNIGIFRVVHLGAKVRCIRCGG